MPTPIDPAPSNRDLAAIVEILREDIFALRMWRNALVAAVTIIVAFICAVMIAAQHTP